MKTLNKRRDGIPSGAVYVGRPSIWGNPFEIGRDGTREDVVLAFYAYGKERLTREPDWLEPLRGRDLVCWCAPALCHVDAIRILLDEHPVKACSAPS